MAKDIAGLIGAIVIGAVLLVAGIGSGNPIIAGPFALGGVVAILAGGFGLYRAGSG
jgi:hypothetical protein